MAMNISSNLAGWMAILTLLLGLGFFPLSLSGCASTSDRDGLVTIPASLRFPATDGLGVEKTRVLTSNNDEGKEGFVLFSDVNRLELAETSVAAAMRFSDRPVAFFCVECDANKVSWASKYPADRLLIKRLPKSKLGIYFSKWDAILASGFERGILVESDSLVTPAINDLWKALHVYSDVDYPLLVKHPDSAQSVSAVWNRLRGGESHMHYAHGHITWTSKAAINFLNKTRSRLEQKDPTLSNVPNADEGTLNIALWMNNSTKQWCLIDPFFRFFLRGEGYVNRPEWSIAWMIIHGNKDPGIAWQIIDRIQEHQQRGKLWWSRGSMFPADPTSLSQPDDDCLWPWANVPSSYNISSNDTNVASVNS